MTNKKAIKRLQSWIDSGYYSLNNQDINWEDDKHAIDLAIKALEEERPQGEWILNKDENPECPFCHCSFTYWGNFCSNCGADMGGKKIQVPSCLTNPERYEELLERYKEE